MSSGKGKKRPNYPKNRKPQCRRAGCVYLAVGDRFGRLVLLEEIPREPKRHPAEKRAWLCRCDCGTEKVVLDASLKTGATISCGCYKSEMFDEWHSRPREKQTRWKGGTRTDKGYISLYCPEHPTRVNSSHKYVPEHRLVMEKHIGRYLRKEETVHHMNGKRDDNRIENLELWAYYHPPGQRVRDLVNWAKELLQIYEPNTLK